MLIKVSTLSLPSVQKGRICLTIVEKKDNNRIQSTGIKFRVEVCNANGNCITYWINDNFPRNFVKTFFGTEAEITK
jgi:hypothetical protein